MLKIKAFLMAFRLRTLPISAACGISAAAIAVYLEALNSWVFLFSLLTIFSLQILSNLANDLGDGQKGTDQNRIGPERAFQSGKLSENDLKKAIFVFIVLSFLFGIILLLVSNIFWWQRGVLFLLGLLAIAAANAYTRGEKPYGYRALGDLSAFLFFGILGIMGSVFLYLHSLSNAAWLVAIGFGFLSVAVLHLNNMRDFSNDQLAGKKTIAIVLGIENSKVYFTILILLGTILWGSFLFTQSFTNIFSYLYWIGFLPMYWILIQFWKIKEPIEYDRCLKLLAISIFLTSILFYISQVV